ncbi:MAG TPA: NADPH-dependent glutamate synthase [Dehalococcoidia bacterium]|nr:NADPH-dependent glutamate synthase [Dehalococcoidia bacterium]
MVNTRIIGTGDTSANTNEVHGRLNIPVQPIAKQAAADRVKNWNEVYFGFDLEGAIVEANRCIDCPTAPCMEACPVHNDIPAALRLLERGDIDGAANKFRETSNLPDMCGRLCPQEKLCEGNCVVGFAIRPGGVQEPPVTIGKLEAFIADHQREMHGGLQPLPVLPPPSGRRVAIIGSGPAGLAVAEELVKLGHACTVYDAWPEPGGVLVYGIPNFKMKKEIVDAKIAFLKRIGVEFVLNTWIGRDIGLDQLLADGFDAVFLGTGAGVGNALKIPGEDEFSGIYAATDFLVRGNLQPDQLPESQREPLHPGRRVVVIGGGDTSMDCVRTAVRLGCEEVTCVYRRTEAEMLGRAEERKHAREEGVRFDFLTIPLRFYGENGRVTGVECQRMELGEPDESGRRRPVPIPGSEFVLAADSVAIAIGYNADPLIPASTPGVRANRWHLVEVDPETGQTSRPEVFAGGDNVNGADLVVTALADGRRAAAAMHRYLASLSG